MNMDGIRMLGGYCCYDNIFEKKMMLVPNNYISTIEKITF